MASRQLPIGIFTSLPPAPAEVTPEGARAAMVTAGGEWVTKRDIVYGARQDDNDIDKVLDPATNRVEHLAGLPDPSRCKHTGGSAQCKTFGIAFSPAAIILEVRYFHLSRPGALGGDAIWHWNLPDFDLIYAMMDAPFIQELGNDGFEVRCHVRNWSDATPLEMGMGVRYRT